MEEQKLQSKNTPKPQVVEGLHFPAIQSSWEDKIRQLRQMELRDDDVFLFTYPRSGTHLLWEMLTMLKKGRPELDKDDAWQCMVELVDDDKLREMPSPRTFTTHLPVSMLPVAEMKAWRVKTVHAYRNPKDARVSFFSIYRSSDWEFTVTPDAFDKFFEYYFFTDTQQGGSHFRHLRQVYQFQQQTADVPSLSLSFEDTKKDPVGCVKKLAQFLCLTASDELYTQIAQACSFDKMEKQAAERAIPDFGDDVVNEALKLDQHEPVVYRKGQIGDWKNYFTVAMNEKVDDLIKQEMEDLPFPLTLNDLFHF